MIQHVARVQHLVTSIRARRSSLDALAQQLRTPTILSAFEKWDHDSWCISVAGDSLIRLRLFTEQNFNVVDTMGLVAVARYTFELSIWLRLFALDRRYGLVYFDQLLDTQQWFHEDMLAQLEREVAWLDALEQKEASCTPAELDAEAARRFSIYAKDAQTNGYGFQVHLVRTKAMPPVRKALADIAAERATFESRVAPDIKALCPKSWRWRPMAQKVGRVNEYDYLYSFASKLLHATPASITTDQKNLELPEMELFLKYMDITIGDILELAAEYGPRPAEFRH